MAPLLAMDEAQRLRLLQSELMSVEERAKEADRELKNNQATILNGWKLFMKSPLRPASCKRYPVDNLPPHTTPANYAGHYRHFTEWLQKKHSDVILLSEVTYPIAADYIADLEKSGVSAGTFNKHIGFFKMFYATLLKDEIIDCINPFEKIERKAGISHSKKPLSREEIASLLQSADGELQLLLALGYFTGLRLGDCCTLLWQEIDEKAGIIRRLPRKTANTRRSTQEGVVNIGIPFLLGRLLNSIPINQRSIYIVPEFAKLYLAGRDNSINRKIQAHFQHNGIKTLQPGTGAGTGKRAVVEFGFHSLRYSYISHNAELGTPAAIIQKNAGHANPAMTEHYTRISDAATVDFAARMRLPNEQEIIDTELISLDDSKEQRRELHRLIDNLSAESLKKVVNLLKPFNSSPDLLAENI